MVQSLRDMQNVPFLSREQHAQVARYMEGTILPEIQAHAASGPGALVSGRAMKDLDTKLGAQARDYLNSGNPDQKPIGLALRQLQMEMRNRTIGTTPQDKIDLQAANEAFKKFLPVEDAVMGSLSSNPGGVPSPHALFKSMEKSGRRPSAVDDAAVIVSPNVSSHANARRITGGLGAGVAGFLNPLVTGLGLAGGYSLYSPTGVRAQLAIARGLQGARRVYRATPGREYIGPLASQIGREAADD